MKLEEEKDPTFAFVVQGSLDKGVIAQLRRGYLSEDVQCSSLTTIKGRNFLFLGLISNIEVSRKSVVDETVRHEGIDKSADEVEREAVLHGLINTGEGRPEIRIIPIAVAREIDGRVCVEGADTIPYYMAEVKVPDESEIKAFYTPQRGEGFVIGYPKSPIASQQISSGVLMDLEVLVRGTFGIFGKSGTGKTFLGNYLASGIVLWNKKNLFSKKVKLLIFDMHSEYGTQLFSSRGDTYGPGVAKAFPEEFLVFSPDHQFAKEHSLEPLQINAGNITIEDLAATAEALGLSEAYLSHLETFRRIAEDILDKYRREASNRGITNWFQFITSLDDELGPSLTNPLEERLRSISPGAKFAYTSGRSRLRRLKRYEFINWFGTGADSVDTIISELLDGKRSVVISFGRYGDDRTAYMFIANIVARRLWRECVDRIMSGRELHYRVVIFIEEAHKFLGPDVYYMSPFGDIARELRKRGVILCVIDQTPSQICDDVRGMLWNKFVMCLENEKDIEAASIGLPFPHLFKPVIQRLQRQEVLVFGEAINVPAVVKVPEYKERIKEMRAQYLEIKAKEAEEEKVREKAFEELTGLPVG
ncbi:MAG: ATP-binding protein [Candidatus Baldrarchaeia archaeon]